MSAEVEGGRALLRGRILGFPVHLDLSFVLIMAALGYFSFPEITAVQMGLWLLIAPAAILVHELGHAVVARAAGAEPQIALAGFGGLTSFTPPRPLSRGWSLGISLAGPLVGLAIGGLLILVHLAVGAGLDPHGWQRTALLIGEFTCIAWSLLNLLPILPLDGGQAVRELLPGEPEVRERRAALVSVVAGTLAALTAFVYLGQPFIAVFMAFFVVSNVLTLRRPAEEQGRPETMPTPEQAVVGLLWQGRPAHARQLLESLPPDPPADLVVHGAVLALTGDPVQGRALLDQEVARRPGDPDVAAVLALTLALAHDWDGLVTVLQGRTGPVVPAAVVERAAQEARGAGRPDVADRLGVLAGDRPHPG